MRKHLVTATIFSALCAGNVFAQVEPADTLPQDTPLAAGQPKANMPSHKPKANMLPVARDGEVIDSIGGGAIPAVLTVEKTQNGIRYITGGVGDEELADLKAQEKEYNTRLLLSSKKGEYLSGVSLRFTDAQGAEVLLVNRAGPYFYAALPPGAYTVEATTAMGETKTTTIKVSEKAAVGAKTHIAF